MEERPSTPQSELKVTPPADDAAGLWFLAVTLGTAVFVIAVSGRWKPVIAFPVVTGCVLAGLAHWLRAALGTVGNRWQSGFVGLLAALATLAAFATAALQQPRLKLPDNPLVKQLLEAVNQQMGTETGGSAWSTRSDLWSQYVRSRYGMPSHVANTMAAGGEALLAAMIAAVLIRSQRVARWFQRGTTT